MNIEIRFVGSKLNISYVINYFKIFKSFEKTFLDLVSRDLTPN